MSTPAPEPSSSSSTRTWLWVLGGLVVVLAIALVVVLVASDDPGNDAAQESTTTSSSTTSSTTTTEPTTTTVAPTTTTQPLPPITNDPQSYAQYLFATWQRGDRTSAANVASATAVEQMFSQPYASNVSWNFEGCNPAAGSLYCEYLAPGGATITMAVRNLTGGLPIQVLSVQRS